MIELDLAAASRLFFPRFHTFFFFLHRVPGEPRNFHTDETGMVDEWMDGGLENRENRGMPCRHAGRPDTRGAVLGPDRRVLGRGGGLSLAGWFQQTHALITPYFFFFLPDHGPFFFFSLLFPFTPCAGLWGNALRTHDFVPMDVT